MRRTGAERFLDDLARTLAEPTPRRGAVRLIGTLLAAIALPRVAPRLASAAETKRSLKACDPGAKRCQQLDEDRKTDHDYCCPYPDQQWQCGDKDNGYKCVNTCPPSIVLNGKTYSQRPTWSRETYEGGQPKKYNCCVVPDTEPRDGECLPNCTAPLGGGGRRLFRCGDTCCPVVAAEIAVDVRYIRCQAGTCVGTCSPGYEECGTNTCCPTNWKCCAGHCCGPTESCCGEECCPQGKFCCDGGGNATQCCDDDEYCEFYAPPGTIRAGAIGLSRPTRCVPKCDPANRCGKQCCGSLFTCVRSGPKQGTCGLNLPPRRPS